MVSGAIPLAETYQSTDRSGSSAKKQVGDGALVLGVYGKTLVTAGTLLPSLNPGLATNLQTMGNALSNMSEYCMQQGGANAADQEVTGMLRWIKKDLNRLIPKVVFVTSTDHNGDMNDEGGSGLTGADAICNARAGEAERPGEFAAWLSTAFTPAKTRIQNQNRTGRVDHDMQRGKRGASPSREEPDGSY